MSEEVKIDDPLLLVLQKELPDVPLAALKLEVKQLHDQLIYGVSGLSKLSEKDLLSHGVKLGTVKAVGSYLKKSDETGSSERASGGFVDDTRQLAKVWQSVLRIRPIEFAEGGAQADLSTGLVFDICHLSEEAAKAKPKKAIPHKHQKMEIKEKQADTINEAALEKLKPYLLLLVNIHAKLANGEVYELLYCSEEGEFYRALTFKMTSGLIWHKKEENDYQILRIELDDAWLVSRGLAEKKEKVSSRKRKGEAKEQTILCKTPRLSFIRIPGQEVCVFGFPYPDDASVDLGRWMGTSRITSIERSTIHLQMLSCPGLSGGAVVTTKDGLLVGFMGGGLDADTNNTQFGSYAYDVRTLPLRPSSRPPSLDLTSESN